MTQTPTKKPSFFRRLSLSSNAVEPHITSAAPAGLKTPRSSSGTQKRWEGGLVAGPSYDTLPPGAAPTFHTGPRPPPKSSPAQRQPTSEGTPLPRRSSSRQQTTVSRPPNGAPSPTAFISLPPKQANAHDPRMTVKERQRAPIYPALASPPNSPPKVHASSRAPVEGSRRISGHSTELGRVDRSYELAGRYPSADHATKAASPVRPKESPSYTHDLPKPPAITQPQLHRMSRYDDAEQAQPNGFSSPSNMDQSVEQRHPRRTTSSSRPVKPTISRGVRSTSHIDRAPPSSYSPPAHSPPATLTEASAYAKAISSTLAKPSPDRNGAASAPPQTTGERRISRPLPRPPSSTSIPSPTRQKSTLHVIASNDGTGRKEARPQDLPKPALALPSPPSDQPRSSFIAFPRSPTLPPLEDPRLSEKKSPVNQWARNVSMPEHPRRPTTLEQSQLPSRSSSVTVQNTRSASNPITSPMITSPTMLTPTQSSPMLPISKLQALSLQRPIGPPTLTTALTQPEIQASLLPLLTINSFLSLMGSSDIIRKRFSGETVGRWVLKEWGVQVDREKGRSWPNLTVWEGFLESLLHDPATYSTYPAQWHNLLRHLSLSYTLIVLHIRSLPAAAFPNSAPLPFDDEYNGPASHMGYSQSAGSLSSLHLPRSRVGSMAGSDAGSLAPGKMPKHERLVEIIMPEPLAAQKESEVPLDPQIRKATRRGSVSSLASAASLSFGRKRSNSTTTNMLPRPESIALISPIAAPIASGKAFLPPVSYPTAKRYGFRRHGDPPSARSRTFSESSRPGSVFSVQSSSSVALSQWMVSSSNGRHGAPPVPGLPSGFSAPPVIGGGSNRASFASSDAGRSSRPSDMGGNSPNQPRFGSPLPIRRDYATPPPRSEPAFDRPLPYIQGRAPILRVFVPISDRVKRWPSAEGAAAAVAELDKCGASRRLQLGDLIVNTAHRQPKGTEHVLIFVPFVKHLLVPLEYKYNITGHLPSYVNGFDVPPSYYYPFLPTPQIIHIDLRPYADRAMKTLRLAYDRRDVTVASGARLTAKRYLHVAGFEIRQGDPAVPEWHGLVSLEAEGTAEGKAELIRRFGASTLSDRVVMAPWEVVREKSISGTVWLRMVKQLI